MPRQALQCVQQFKPGLFRVRTGVKHHVAAQPVMHSCPEQSEHARAGRDAKLPAFGVLKIVNVVGQPVKH